MKKALKFLGIIAIAALVGFSFVSCDLDNPKADATALAINTWSAEGDLPDSKAEKWFSFDVTSGTTYYFWAKDTWTLDLIASGDDEDYAWLSLDLEYEDGTSIFEDKAPNSNTAASTSSTAAYFEASQTGKVYMRVYADTFWKKYGKYRIAFTSTTTRPAGH